MNRKSLLSLTFLTALGPSFAATNELYESVGEPLYQITDHLIFSNAADPFSDARTNTFMHEDFVHVEYGIYGADIRFTNRLDSITNDQEKHFVLEKKTLSLTWDQAQIKLGDSHHEFGKGVALSLYQDDTFGVNHTLEGAALNFTPGNWNLTGIAGRVNTMKNPVAVNPVEDPLGNDTLWILGGAAQWRPSGESKLGTHYFIALKAPEEEKIRRFDRFWNTFGLTWEKQEIVPDVDLYIESNLLLPQRLVDEDFVKENTGVGSYASLTWAPLPWKVRLEAKDYRDYSFPLRRAPTLEDDLVETDHSENVFGTRIHLERKDIARKLTYLGSYMYGYDRFVERPIHHPIFGVNFSGFSKTDWEFRVGHRRMPEYAYMSHTSLKVKIPTVGQQKLEANVQKQYITENIPTTATHIDRNRLDLTYTFSHALNTSIGYEFVPTNGEDAGKHFFKVGAEVRTGNLSAKAFVGQTSGGTQCSAGVCRVVPPYSGAMLETVYTF